MPNVRSLCRRLSRSVISLLALGIAGCASPGANDYAAAASDYARQARDERALAQQNEAASQVLGSQGDEAGAALSRQGAEDSLRDANRHEFQATKDYWLSRWWPAPSVSSH
jgi:hypothetical protein